MDLLNRSWSIHSQPEIIQKYKILERVDASAYSDACRGRRLSNDLIVALKEIHDYQSAFREIEAFQVFQSSPNVAVLHEYFWSSLIKDAKRNREGGISVGEIKRWMVQILHAVDACHRNSIVHRRDWRS